MTSTNDFFPSSHLEQKQQGWHSDKKTQRQKRAGGSVRTKRRPCSESSVDVPGRGGKGREACFLGRLRVLRAPGLKSGCPSESHTPSVGAWEPSRACVLQNFSLEQTKTFFLRRFIPEGNYHVPHNCTFRSSRGSESPHLWARARPVIPACRFNVAQPSRCAPSSARRNVSPRSGYRGQSQGRPQPARRPRKNSLLPGRGDSSTPEEAF